MNDTPHIEHIQPSPDHYDTHVSNPWVEQNIYIHQKQELSPLPTFDQARTILPDPFWAGHEATRACYWRAWELAFSNLKQPTKENDFAANFCDTAFNGNLYMWDSCFITCFGLYGRRAFDFQKTLDTFYRKQHADGFICREITETDGQDCYHRFDPSTTGPNVMAWAEWNHYCHTGDKERLVRVFPALVAFHQWLRKYHTWMDGSYWTSGWGSGMDNLPRLGSEGHLNFDHGHVSWVDATFQALLSAKCLLMIAGIVGRQEEVQDLDEEVENLENYCNSNLWDKQIKFYFDRFASGRLSTVKHIGAYWGLLARAVPVNRLADFIAHLDDPKEFKRVHRIPALSADDPEYSPTGGYWCGGIWAPTNYMTLKGLDGNGYDSLAHEIAINHLDCVVKVFESDARWTGADQFRNFFHLEKLDYDDHNTLWETYAPDEIAPGEHSKPGYVGWTGIPPIAVLIEDVFGISENAPENRLIWKVCLTDEHGVHRYPFGSNGMLDLKCNARLSPTDRPSIEVHSNVPLKLNLLWEGGADTLTIEKDQ
jgi:hypothetical protein